MIGKRLGDRYELEARIGSGGMAVVYLAKDQVLDRHVAVKILNESLSNDENFVDRFRREARAAAKLSHPNVVNIYDVGQDGTVHYIVMEHIEGRTLKERIRDEGKLSIAEAVTIGEQIADALDHAHENGIVHRDIKSHNIMIGPRGRVKVADFGIARATSSQTITHTGSVMGSVHYFSPEQARGGYIGEKSDIYSLGVVLYEMVTGELPFSDGSPISVALKHLQDEPEDPIKRRPGLPQSVDNIIRRAMAKDVLHRHNTANELQKDLNTALSPSRLNEPRWEPGDLDGEKTMVMPALRSAEETGHADGNNEGNDELTAPSESPGQQSALDGTEAEFAANRASPAGHLSRLEREERSGRVQDGSGGGPPWWKRTAFVMMTVLLIGTLSIFGLNMLFSLMSKDGVTVPDVVGMSLAEASSELESAGLVAEAVEEAHDSEAGTVFRQSPGASERVKKGFAVKLYVSQGDNGNITIPNMINSPQEAAKQALYDLGVSPDQIEVEWLDDDGYAPGHVVKQRPASGTELSTDDRVTLFVRPEANMVEIPNLNGKFQSTAEEELRALGFRVYRNGPEGAIYDREASAPLHRVFGSTPAPGTLLAKGEVVRLHVSLNNSYGGSGGEKHRQPARDDRGKEKPNHDGDKERPDGGDDKHEDEKKS